MEQVLWAWKGDYINLGAGAELGIYYGGGPHWFVDKGLAQNMELCLMYKNERIIYWTPNDPQWWITGFHPAYQNVKAGDLRAVFTVFFNDKAMYDALRSQYINNSTCMFGYRYGAGYNVTIML